VGCAEKSNGLNGKKKYIRVYAEGEESISCCNEKKKVIVAAKRSADALGREEAQVLIRKPLIFNKKGCRN
jgi:hypothetical protein